MKGSNRNRFLLLMRPDIKVEVRIIIGRREAYQRQGTQVKEAFKMSKFLGGFRPALFVTITCGRVVAGPEFTSASIQNSI